MLNYNFIFGLLFLVLAFVYYKVHKSWYQDSINKLEDKNPMTISQKFQNWLTIIVFIFLALFSLIKYLLK